MKYIQQLVLCLVLTLSISTATLFADSLKLNAGEYPISLKSSSGYDLIYSSTTGLIYKIYKDKTGNEVQRTAIKGFGPVLNLPQASVDNLYEDERFILIQHGPWMSLIDLKANKLEFKNIGPFEPSVVENQKYATLSDNNGKPYALTFLADAFSKGSNFKERKSVLITYDFEAKRMGYFYLSKKYRPTSFIATPAVGSNNRRLKLDVGFHSIKKKVMFKDPTGSLTPGVLDMTPKSIKLDVDLDTQALEIEGSTEFVSPDSPEHEGNKYYILEPQKEFMARFESKDFKDSDLLSAAQPGDSRIKEILAADLSHRFDQAADVKSKILQGMTFIRGQDHAKEELVRVSQDQVLGTNKIPVVLMAGPTGVGKTSGFHAWVQSLLPNSKEVVYEVDLGRFKSAEFLSTFLFGSTQGYIGSNSPTGLMIWILTHQEGGGIFFDEVEKMDPDGQAILLRIVESGQIKMHPAMTKEYVKGLVEGNVPVEQWHPDLREATSDGEHSEVEVTLKLNPNKYKIGFGSNAGAWLYNGLKKDHEGNYDNEALKKVNGRLTIDVVKNELMQSGMKSEFINRIHVIIPYPMLTFEEHSMVVEDKINAIDKEFNKKYFVDVKLSPELLTFLKKTTFDPPSGMRAVETQINGMVRKRINDLLVNQRTIKPGDSVLLDFKKQDGPGSKPSILISAGKPGSELSLKGEGKVNIRMPVDVSPILKYAEENLANVFKKRIVGHEEETKAITNLVLARLKKAKDDPNPRDRYVEMFYEEGPPGNGKTERARAASEGLLGNSSAFVVIDGNSIATYDDFLERAIKPLIQASQDHPEGLYVLWDELPRMGSAHPSYSKSIQNALLSIVDKGILPAIPGATHVVNGRTEPDTRKTELPTFTVFHATGNLFEQALTRDGGQMTNRQLHAEKRYMGRHPERFIAVYEQNVIAALRSRMGDPIIGNPLLDSEVETLRDRFFENNVRAPMLKKGVDIVLSPSAKEFFLKYYVPILGGRWVRKQMSVLIENPIVGTLEGDLSKPEYKDSNFEVVYDKKKEEMRIVAKSKTTNEIQSGIRLGKFQRTVSEYSPESLAQAEHMIRIHEAGHAIVTRALINAYGSVQEMNVFGGINGGWMEPGTNVPNLEIYTSSRSGVIKMAIMLGGHAAEENFLNRTSTGASNDFERARDTATSMLINGGTLGLAPIPLFRNPKNGELEPSEKNKEDLEEKQLALMRVSKKLADWIVSHNRLIVVRLADALARNPEMSLGVDEIENIISKSNFVVPTTEVLKSLINESKLTRTVCASLLTREKNTLWSRLKERFVKTP